MATSSYSDNGHSDTSGSLTSSYIQLEMEPTSPELFPETDNPGANLGKGHSYDFHLPEENFTFVTTNDGQFMSGVKGDFELQGAGLGNFNKPTVKWKGFGTSYMENHGFGWLMEFEESDSDNLEKPLLEELDIDLRDIFYKVRCVIFPCPYLGYNRQTLRENPDFWGPLFVVLLYSLLSVYGQFKVVSWIITIWIFGTILIFMLARVLGGEVSYSQCLGIIGYSVLPLILTATMLPILSQFYWYGITIKLLGVSWAAYSAGSLLCMEDLHNKKPLLLYPVFLMYIYLLSLHTGA
ncbi:Protein yipf4, variant 2 [Chamberlinius hualienensis]